MTLLDRLLKPKTRPQGLDRLPVNAPRLVEAARDGADPATRRAALGRISDLTLLAERAAADPDDAVRAVAQTRYRDLLAGDGGAAADAPPLSERLARLPAEPSELLRYLARHGREPALREAALVQLDEPTLYCERAVDDPSADLRLRALAAVGDADLLTRIAEQTRNRDKRVYRGARERLDARRNEQQRAARLDQLCDQLEALRWDGEGGPAATRLALLQSEWQTLHEHASEVQRQRYQTGCAELQRQREHEHARRRQRDAVCATLQTLLDAGDGDPAALRRRIDAALADAGRLWDETAADDAGDSATGAVATHPAALERQRQTQRYRTLRDALDERRDRLQRRSDDRENTRRQRRAAYKALQKLQSRRGRLDPADVAALRRRCRELPAPDGDDAAALAARIDAALDALDVRLQRQHALKDEELTALTQRLDELQRALDAGELQRAEALDRALRDGIAGNMTLTPAQSQTLRERHGRAAVGLETLRGWQRWGNERAREQLCEEVERLLDGATPAPEQLAERVRAAREQWKKLDRGGATASRALWRRFDSACNRAYEPARAHFDAQARERADNLQRRQALCAELEQLLADTPWDGDPDWDALGRVEQSAQQRWRRLGPVDRGQKKAIDERYRGALSALQARLKPQLERDYARRRGLIQRVQTLLEQDDTGAAIAAAKQAQADWQPRLRGPRRVEQALWRSLREVCDAAFARRQDEQDRRQAERRDLGSRLAALCEELDRLDPSAGAAARERAQALQQAWDVHIERYREHVGPHRERPSGRDDGGRERRRGPRQDRELRALEQRYRRALQQFEQGLAGERRRALDAEIDALRARAALCARLEALLPDAGANAPGAASTADAGANAPGAASTADAGAAAVAEVRERTRADWQQLGPVAAALAAPVEQRFADVDAALSSADPEPARRLAARLRHNVDAKQRLCLQMEILRGRPTPDAFAAERMRYQIERLSQTMTERRGAADADAGQARLLERDWAGLGVLPAATAAALQQRFDRARGD